MNNVSDISAISATFQLDIKAFFNWCDEALVGREKGATVDYVNESGDGVTINYIYRYFLYKISFLIVFVNTWLLVFILCKEVIMYMRPYSSVIIIIFCT